MTHDEFKNWFQGLVDATDGELSKKHCDKVLEKLKEITPVSVPYYIYGPQWGIYPYPPPPFYPADVTYSPSLTSTSFEGIVSCEDTSAPFLYNSESKYLI